jgi:hypothetical protein
MPAGHRAKNQAKAGANGRPRQPHAGQLTPSTDTPSLVRYVHWPPLDCSALDAHTYIAVPGVTDERLSTHGALVLDSPMRGQPIASASRQMVHARGLPGPPSMAHAQMQERDRGWERGGGRAKVLGYLQRVASLSGTYST